MSLVCPQSSPAKGSEEEIIMESSMSKTGSDLSAVPGSDFPTGASIFSRKVARSGHISYEGRPYFISKALAGRYIRLVVLDDRLIVDTFIPLHKEYALSSGTREV